MTIVNTLRPPFKDRYSHAIIKGQAVVALYFPDGDYHLVEYQRYLLSIENERFLSLAEYEILLKKKFPPKEEPADGKSANSQFSNFVRPENASIKVIVKSNNCQTEKSHLTAIIEQALAAAGYNDVTVDMDLGSLPYEAKSVV